MKEIHIILLLLRKGQRGFTNRLHHPRQIHLPAPEAVAAVQVAAAEEAVAVALVAGHQEVTKRFVNE